MHICDHHIKVYYKIEKRKLVKIEIEIYRGRTEMNQYLITLPAIYKIPKLKYVFARCAIRL